MSGVDAAGELAALGGKGSAAVEATSQLPQSTVAYEEPRAAACSSATRGFREPGVVQQAGMVPTAADVVNSSDNDQRRPLVLNANSDEEVDIDTTDGMAMYITAIADSGNAEEPPPNEGPTTDDVRAGEAHTSALVTTEDEANVSRIDPAGDGDDAEIDEEATSARPATRAAALADTPRSEDASDEPIPQVPATSNEHQLPPPTRGAETTLSEQRHARAPRSGNVTATASSTRTEVPPRASSKASDATGSAAASAKATRRAKATRGGIKSSATPSNASVSRAGSVGSVATDVTNTVGMRRVDKEGQAVRQSAREMDATHTFWSNRLHLLRREVEAARIKAHMKRLEDDNHEAVTLANTTTASQLRAERQQQEASRLERSDMIRQQRVERRIAFKATLHQTVLTKMEEGRRLKNESQHQRSMVDQLRQEVLESKRQSRSKVLEEKAKAVEKRKKEQAVIEEKARRLYELKMDHMALETHLKEAETRALVEESGKLLEQLRRLQRLDDVKDGMVTADDIEGVVQE